MNRAAYAEKVCERIINPGSWEDDPQKWNWREYLARWTWLRDKGLERDP